MGTVLFFLLSTLTGVIEIGSVLYAIQQSYSTVQILLIVLAYQIGCFFPTNITLKKPILVLMGIISFALTMLLFYIPTFWLLTLAVLFVSPCLQVVRSIHKSSVSTGIKRVFRILGFAVSPLFNPIFLSVIAIVILIILALSKKNYINKISIGIIPMPNLLMVVHQMHYFSYAYIVLMITSRLDNYNGFLTALIFVLGWITYSSTQYILRGKQYLTYLVCGHVFLALILTVMALCESDLIKVFLWILTGFGGGTVFCIKEILKQHGKYDNYALETSENFGHVIGVIACICVYTVFKNTDATILFASACAALTVILVFYFRLNGMKETNYD